MYCISISYKTALVSVREQFAFTLEEQKEFIDQLKQQKMIDGAVILCTCNRSEIYITGEKEAVSILQRELARYKNKHVGEILNYLHIYSEDKAIRHLYQVCCGIDSMVLGEDEILRQVKTAYSLSLELGFVNYELNIFFQRAIACAKKIKTNTNLSKTPISIATLVANEIFHFPKEKKQVLIIGITGQIGNILLKNIVSKPNIEILGTIRSHKTKIKTEIKASNLMIIDYIQRYQYIDNSDIIISATTSPHYTITYDKLKEWIRQKKERLFLDLSVPIDIDPYIQEIEGVKLYNIDQFQELSKLNNKKKLKELDIANAIMENYIDEVKKEILFHDYLTQIEKTKKIVKEKSLESILYTIRDNVDSKKLEIILDTLSQLENWL